MHHIPHTWINSCREAGFSREGVFHNLRTEQIHAEGRVGVHPLNLGKFSKSHAFFSLDTRFHNFVLKVLVNL